MKLKILNSSKTEIGDMTLPIQFFETIRKDIIEKAFLSTQSSKIQPYGAFPEAGKRSSAEVSRRRRKYRGSYGLGISRVPRKIMSRRGTRMVWVGAFAPGTVGGRRAHPPKADKIWEEDINKKERRKAIRSAISATINNTYVAKRGHKIPSNYPFIIKEDDLKKIQKTKELKDLLVRLGFGEELERSKIKETRGLLIVTSSTDLTRASSNLKGFECIDVNYLSVELLAPGGVPGRMTLFSDSAIIELAEKKLFTKNYKGPSNKQEEIVVDVKKAEPKKAKKIVKVVKTKSEPEAKVKPKTQAKKKELQVKK